MRLLILWGVLTASIAQAAPLETSFSQALEQILTNSTSVAIQKQKVQEAEARHTGEIGAFLPTLSVSANRAKSDQIDGERTSLSAEASINLFRFGADVAGLKAAKSERDAAKVALTESELKAEAAAVKALVDILVDSQALEIAKQRADDTKKLLDIAEARYRRGVLAREEADQVAIDYSNATAALKNAESKLNEDFAEVSKLSPTTDLKANRLKRDWPWKKQLDKDDVARLLQLSTSAQEVPAFKVAQLSLNSARLRTRQAKRSIFPSIDFSYGRDRAEELGIQTDGWSSVISLRMPILEGLTDYTSYRVQHSAEVIAEYQLMQAQRDTPVRQEIAKRNLEIAAETAVEREKTLAVARRLFASSLRRFQAGRANANALAQDQQRVSQAENLSAEGWAQAHMALAEFLHAHGRSIRNL